MKQVVATAAALLVFVFLLPMLLFGGKGLAALPPLPSDTPPAILPSQVTPVPAAGTADRERTVTLLRHGSGEIETMTDRKSVV